MRLAETENGTGQVEAGFKPQTRGAFFLLFFYTLRFSQSIDSRSFVKTQVSWEL